MQTFLEYASSDSDHKIMTLYSSNVEIKKIHELTGASVGEIYRTLERYGIKPRRRNKKDLHDLIVNYARSGTPLKRIAELTGYSEKHVKNIIKKHFERVL